MKKDKKINEIKDNVYMCNDRVDFLIDKNLKIKFRKILLEKEINMTEFFINKIKEFIKENDKKS